jgi:hypothetical protein
MGSSSRHSGGSVAHLRVENALAFQVPGDQEENEHGGGSPAEHLHRKCSREPRAAGACALPSIAKNQATHQGNSSCQRQKHEGVPNSLMDIAEWSQESSIEQGIQRENAKNNRDQLGDLGHALNLTQLRPVYCGSRFFASDRSPIGEIWQRCSSCVPGGFLRALCGQKLLTAKIAKESRKVRKANGIEILKLHHYRKFPLLAQRHSDVEE